MKQYGLIGHPLTHSFSKSYFTEKFEKEGIDGCYRNFDLDEIALVRHILSRHPDLKGFNVTIPYKEAILPYLDELDETTAKIKAVNTVKVLSNGKLKGFNTDVVGFEALLERSGFREGSALVLGTGGAAKAVQYVLKKKQIAFQLISRDSSRGDLTYEALTPTLLKEHHLIVNATPLGTFPHVDEAPPIPYDALTQAHTLIDLVYNPAETLFLRQGAQRGAKTFNGLTMLIAQAEASWRVWN